MNQLSNLNWWSVLAAFLPYAILGALWFTLFFIKPYKIALGKANQVLDNKPPIVNIAIDPNIPRPIQYGFITGSYHLVEITIASIIIVVMK